MDLKYAKDFKVKDIETLREWARKNGITPSAATVKATKGLIPAFRLENSNVWLIRKDVKNPDSRSKRMPNTPRNSYSKTYYDKNLDTHCCVRCGKVLPEGYNKKTCPDCLEKMKQKRGSKKNEE